MEQPTRLKSIASDVTTKPSVVPTTYTNIRKQIALIDDIAIECMMKKHNKTLSEKIIPINYLNYIESYQETDTNPSPHFCHNDYYILKN